VAEVALVPDIATTLVVLVEEQPEEITIMVQEQELLALEEAWEEHLEPVVTELLLAVEAVVEDTMVEDQEQPIISVAVVVHLT
jgi:hypothetical protein